MSAHIRAITHPAILSDNPSRVTFDCPVCLEENRNLEDDSMVCENMHMTCGKCAAKISKCPICRVKVRPSPFEIHEQFEEILRELAALSIINRSEFFSAQREV